MKNQNSDYVLNSARLAELIKPKPSAVYQPDFHLSRVESGLDSLFSDYGGVDFDPDYQRGHVWTPDQQTSFIEALIRGHLPKGLLQLQFNCPHFLQTDYVSPDLPKMVQCIDGLQRYTAMLGFIKGTVKAFGMTHEQFDNSEFSVKGFTFSIAVHVFKTKKEVLEFYLNVNNGGTPHSTDELARVQNMYDACR